MLKDLLSLTTTRATYYAPCYLLALKKGKEMYTPILSELIKIVPTFVV